MSTMFSALISSILTDSSKYIRMSCVWCYFNFKCSIPSTSSMSIKNRSLTNTSDTRKCFANWKFIFNFYFVIKISQTNHNILHVTMIILCTTMQLSNRTKSYPRPRFLWGDRYIFSRKYLLLVKINNYLGLRFWSTFLFQFLYFFISFQVYLVYL